MAALRRSIQVENEDARVLRIIVQPSCRQGTTVPVLANEPVVEVQEMLPNVGAVTLDLDPIYEPGGFADVVSTGSVHPRFDRVHRLCQIDAIRSVFAFEQKLASGFDMSLRLRDA